jgi:hypothetical protein
MTGALLLVGERGWGGFWSDVEELLKDAPRPVS